MEKFRLKLMALAQRDCWDDQEDFDPSDYSGENFDDAYQGGLEDGKAHLARALLAEFFPVDEPK